MASSIYTYCVINIFQYIWSFMVRIGMVPATLKVRQGVLSTEPQETPDSTQQSMASAELHGTPDSTQQHEASQEPTAIQDNQETSNSILRQYNKHTREQPTSSPAC